MKLNAMNIHKRAAIEFCMNKYVSNKLLDIFLVIFFTLGLAILIFPILIWVVYRYYKARKQMKLLREQIINDANLLDKVHAISTFNSIVIHINGMSFEIPQVYLWFSKYSKNDLVNMFNN
jgi:hypothetical protein